MVRAGYKQTEVGEIPEDWDVYEIQQLAKTGSGTTPARALHNKYYAQGKHNWVKTTDLNNSNINETEEKVSSEAIAETCLQVYPVETILVAMYGGFNQIGRTGILRVPAAVNQALVAIKTNPKNLNPRFLLDVLNYRVLDWRKVASSSRKDPNITSNDVKGFKLSLPTITEQKAIAKALSDVDELIASLEKLITKKRDIKTATMQQLLTGKKRLPGFGEGKGYKQTELGEIPEDWKIITLGEFADITKLAGFEYSNYFNSYKDGGDIIVVRGTNITNNVLDLSDVKSIPLETSKQLPRSKLNKGDLVFAYVGTIGPVYLIEEDNKFHLGPNTAKITCKRKLDTRYLLAYFKSQFIKSEVEEKTSVGAQPSLSMTKIRSFRVIYPSLQEQKDISAILDDIDSEISRLETSLYKTKAIKQGMMQELLTGRTRLLVKEGTA